MRPEFEKYSLIDNYLGGKLSEQENSAFEQSMAEDSSLRQEVFDRKVVNEIIIEQRFFDIASGLRTPAGGGISRTLFSNSVKRFVGIGAAVAVILFTPYYFNKRTEEQPIENTSSPEQKSETAEIAIPLAEPQIQTAQEVTLEEQVDTLSAEPIVEEVVPEKAIETAPTIKKAKPAVATVKKKKGAKSSILEIPIDDPSAKGHQANSYVINPAKGQSWKIPMHNHKEATVTIFNKEGAEVFTSSVQQGKTTTWKGVSNEGVKQKAGKYAYLLDYGNGNIEHGHVTINP